LIFENHSEGLSACLHVSANLWGRRDFVTSGNGLATEIFFIGLAKGGAIIKHFMKPF